MSGPNPVNENPLGYSPVYWPKTSWTGNQGNHKNFQNGRLKKSMFLKIVNSQYFFYKIEQDWSLGQ